MDSINAERYSLMQLKAWCTAVGINASGAKSSLAARLNELSAEARGLCPVDKWGGLVEGGLEDGVDDDVEGNVESNVGDRVEDGVESNGRDNGKKKRDDVQQRQRDTVVEVGNDDGAGCVQNKLARIYSGTFGHRLSKNCSSDARENNSMSNVANGTVEDNLKITLLQREIELLKLQKALLEKEMTTNTRCNF